jgi:hypothetical protein
MRMHSNLSAVTISGFLFDAKLLVDCVLFKFIYTQRHSLKKFFPFSRVVNLNDFMCLFTNKYFKILYNH